MKTRTPVELQQPITPVPAPAHGAPADCHFALGQGPDRAGSDPGRSGADGPVPMQSVAHPRFAEIVMPFVGAELGGWE